MARLMRSLKPSSKTGVTLVENNGEVATVKTGRISDSHFISPETDPERLRMLGALGEMLFEEAKKAFNVDSLLVVAQNADFRIAMFPKDGGIAVWKTNLEVHELLDVLRHGNYAEEKHDHKHEED
jgi:hypothetical protein